MRPSIHAYACHHNALHVAVKKAINTGRTTLLSGGMVDLDTADAQRAQNTLQPRKVAAPERISLSKAYVLPGHEVLEPDTSPLPMGGASLLQTHTVNEVPKAQFNKVELAHRRRELVDRAQVVARMLKLTRIEHDAWLNRPTRISGQTASTSGVDAHQMHVALGTAVHEHLTELGELRPCVD